jgi:UDP-N-acetylmuramoyl-L-alanyl-D-glutamate--2,6-diaminopimelate ligase
VTGPEHHIGEDFARVKSLVAGGLAVKTDSRLVVSGDVFVALPGREDASRFIPDALSRGAAFVVARPGAGLPAGSDATLVVHPDPRAALGDLAAAYFKTDQHPVTLIGITGTNGKTTVSYLLEHLLTTAGRKVGVIGTVNYRWPGFSLKAPLTTPSCWQLHELLSNMAAAEVDTVIMEVSSHSLDQQRVAGLNFNLAILTNVTQDHLDYHGTMDAYFRAKSKLFAEVPAVDKVGIINFDDPYGRMLLARHSRSVGYGLVYPGTCEGPGLVGEILECTSNGLRLGMSFQDKRWDLTSPLVGRHNAQNLLAAQAAGLALGLKPRQLKALSNFLGVPGRLERVVNDRGLDVFVDYAHTPDALENVLRTLDELEFRRILVVFGCGGDRDRAKRPLMGEAVCRYADVAVLTSDNPRSEDPLAIMRDVKPGLAACAGIMEEPDRRRAIALALAEMEKGDVLLIAGKGHEDYQEIKGVRYPFSDPKVVRELIAGKD